jgi:molybdopterin molybdotransferase
MTLTEPSWDAAREAAYKLGTLGRIEKLPISQLVDRYLAVDALALVQLPTYETSAMDGYVVSGAGPWKLIGEIKAGAPFKGILNSGEALGIATGAVIPAGAFGVIRWENANVNGEILSGETSERKDFRAAGEEARLNEVLVRKGSKLTPAMVGLIAAAGYDEIEVFKKPKVALLLLGDEIQLTGIPSDGLVRDSLGPQLPGWISKLGCDVIHLEYVPDDLNFTIDAINKASNNFDVVMTTGGTADGPRDFLKIAVAKLNGSLIVDKVACRPGHPQVLAEVNGKPLIGLPGNPQSAVVALMTLGAPLIQAIFDKPLSALPEISTKDKFEAQPGFTRLVLGTLNNGEFTVGEYLGSAMLRSLAHADGFAVCTNPPTQLRWLGLPL